MVVPVSDLSIFFFFFFFFFRTSAYKLSLGLPHPVLVGIIGNLCGRSNAVSD